MPLAKIPKHPPPFHKGWRKMSKNGKFNKFMAMLKQLSINVPLVEALEQMSGYTKLMKDLVTKKRMMRYEPIDNIHHYSAIAMRSLVQKKLI